MKISKRAEYGLCAMVHLAKNLPTGKQSKNKRAISIREISNIEGVPFEFLSKIFSGLEKAGLVSSKHGASGGYYLAKPANLITAGNIVETIEGKINPVNCFLCVKAKNCASKSVWDKVRRSLSKTLYSIKLSDLVK
ncbi:MAG: Rrf2 family transcriptional regulator [Candidatus Staskawiczbacteria bacterium]|jgi:Rrf2 family protein